MNSRFFTGKINIIILGVICTLLWGSAFPAVKTGYEAFGIAEATAFSKILFAGIRFTFAAVLVLLFSTVKNRRFSVTKKSSLPFLCILGLVYTAVQYICFYIGLSNTSGSKASVMNGSIVFFSVILAHIFFKDDKLTVKKLTGCIIGFAGIVIINITGNETPGFSFKGEGMILLSSVAMAAGSVMIRKKNSCESSEVTTGYQMLLGGLLLVLTGILGGGRLNEVSLKGIVILCYLSLLSATAFTIWNTLLVYNPVGKIAVFNFLTPVFGSVLSAVFLGENILSLKNLTALILVSGGIFTVYYNKESKQKNDATL